MQMPCLAAARAVPTSPSGWANWCVAAGAKPNGKLTLSPKIELEVSMLATLTRMRGRILYRLNASSLSRRLYGLSACVHPVFKAGLSFT